MFMWPTARSGRRATKSDGGPAQLRAAQKIPPVPRLDALQGHDCINIFLTAAMHHRLPSYLRYTGRVGQRSRKGPLTPTTQPILSPQWLNHFAIACRSLLNLIYRNISLQ
jgi:hypothetical protein